ncbi:MAG: hypothetical protein GMKNLPBB_00805 [Myxococcota bacterium]|nr:hypothetical protein [Myxococcota bacterium]
MRLLLTIWIFLTALAAPANARAEDSIPIAPDHPARTADAPPITAPARAAPLSRPANAKEDDSRPAAVAAPWQAIPPPRNFPPPESLPGSPAALLAGAVSGLSPAPVTTLDITAALGAVLDSSGDMRPAISGEFSPLRLLWTGHHTLHEWRGLDGAERWWTAVADSLRLSFAAAPGGRISGWSAGVRVQLFNTRDFRARPELISELRDAMADALPPPNPEACAEGGVCDDGPMPAQTEHRIAGIFQRAETGHVLELGGAFDQSPVNERRPADAAPDRRGAGWLVWDWRFRNPMSAGASLQYRHTGFGDGALGGESAAGAHWITGNDRFRWRCDAQASWIRVRAARTEDGVLLRAATGFVLRLWGPLALQIGVVFAGGEGAAANGGRAPPAITFTSGLHWSGELLPLQTGGAP